MNTGSEILPYFVVFHPMAHPNYHFSMQQIMPQTPNLIWSYTLPATASTIEPMWPEKV
jgi:hypothetical protein